MPACSDGIPYSGLIGHGLAKSEPTGRYLTSTKTRLKESAAFAVVEECEIPQNRNIRADQLIRLTGVQALADYPELLRRIVAWGAENEREIVLLTNLLEFGATTIAAIYKERWQTELFFKASSKISP
jgi:IS4 transposase